MRTPRATSRTRRRLLVRFGGGVSFTSDVSQGGLCLGLMKVLPEGTAISGTIRLAGQDVPFAARVAWSRPGDRHLGLAGRMGVTFTGAAQAGTLVGQGSLTRLVPEAAGAGGPP